MNKLFTRLLFVLLFCFFNPGRIFAQVACCPQSSLTLNTAYDPTTGSAIGYWTVDPHWQTSLISTVMQSNLTASAPPRLYGGSTAWAVDPFGLWYTLAPVGVDCGWIGCFKGMDFDDNPSAYGSGANDIHWTVKREFEICTPNTCEQVSFNLSFASDNYILRAYVDGVSNTFFTQPGLPTVHTNYDQLTPNGAYTLCLSPGIHTIYVEVYEDNFLGKNPAGVCVRGTISSPSGAAIFRSEAAGCAGWPYFCTVPPITGSHDVCVGKTTTLHDPITGGTWTSSNTGIATVGPSSGLVTGVSAGAVTITYTDPCNRIATYPVTVHALPTLVSGSLTLCKGESTSLVATPAGGPWSGGGAYVSITPGGFATAISAGTENITYTDPTYGCQSTFSFTVNPREAITGPTSICIGTPRYISDPVAGGTWTSSSPGTGSIDPSTGLVTGITPGTTTMTYTLSTGCTVTRVVTINPVPVLTGMTPTCPLTSFIVDHSPWTGGSWSIDHPDVASVGTYSSTEGIVTGIKEGTATITYVPSTGCIATATISILHGPPPISPRADICVGDTKTLTDGEAGGTWSSGDVSIATIGSTSGILTGVDTGYVIITYTLPNGCFDTVLSHVTTVVPISNLTICPGQTTKFYGSPTPGIWSISGTSASIVPTTGDATGITTGTVSLTYTTSAGCRTITTLTILPLPAPITGKMSICLGDFTTLSDATTGGTWRSSPPGLASIDPVTGVVEGKFVGTATITYESPLHCLIMDTMTVNPNPAPILGDTVICLHVGSTLTDGTPGGTWSSSDTTIVSVGGGGTIYGASAGTATLSYILPTGCFTTVKIKVIPPPSSIGGPTSVCLLSSITLSDASPGGTWSTGATIVTVGSTSGTVTAGSIYTGTAIITYTTARFCTALIVVTVNPLPSILADTPSLCGIGSTTTVLGGPGGGTWSSSNTAVITIDGTGHATSVGYGTSTITYTLPTGCYSTQTLTVSPFPDPITGYLKVCVGDTTRLSDATPGGSWYSLDIHIATVDLTTGLVHGVAPGTTTITYFMPSTCYVLVTVTVLPLPAVITGPSTVCEGLTISLTDATSGGTWSSASTLIATVGSGTGIVTGVSRGTTTITYSAGSCPATKVITVIPSPIYDKTPFDMCVNAAPVFMAGDPTGGTYSSGSTAIATVDAGTGFVTPVSPGTATITYAYGGCYVTMTVTIDPLPAPISGTLSVCQGLTNGLSDADAGGGWSSSNTYTATINSSTGIYTGVNPGTCVITYTLPTGCFVTTTITVEPNPIIIGTPHVCETMTTTLGIDIPGGTWSGGSISTATVDPSTGIITGIAPGTTTITYVTAAGCSSTTVVTVIPIPAPVTGPDSACVHAGLPITMSDATPGGTWSSSNVSRADIGLYSGAVTLHSAGIVTFTYTMPSGCYATKPFLVQDVPAVPPITGMDRVCPGFTTTLMDAYPGGKWSTSATVASVDTATGVVTGVALGTALITYTATNDCGSDFTTFLVTITTIEQPITGNFNVCSGSTTQLSNYSTGGTWVSLDPSVATVDAASGVVTGVRSGTAIIQYTAIGPCAIFVTTVTITVNPDPFITTNYIVACHGVIDHAFGYGYSLPDSGCTLVCDSTVVRYYANGVSGSRFTWTVTGGTVIANYGDSIDVFWSTLGVTGSVSITDTFSHCIGAAHHCIQVIEKPQANFSASATSLCQGGKVIFKDLSTFDPYSPIVSWHWDFGDGSFSSLEFPDHKFTTANANDTVTLVVRNECSCTDTVRMVLHISSAVAPEIACPSAVCDSEIAVYSTPATCGIYNWSVKGGIIIGGAGTPSIRVRWTMVDTSGFGYVSLAEPCAPCPDTTTIKVPVILKNAQISGPSIACTDHMYQYFMPLWPATEYAMGAWGGPVLLQKEDDYKVGVEFFVPGTYVLHERYQNHITLCGGNVFKTVTVWPSIHIVGGSVCQYSTARYELSDTTLTAAWTITDTGGAVVASGSGWNIPYLFTIPGKYVVTATGLFCANPITITVTELPPPVDSVVGGATPVCIGHIYSYTAMTSVPGTTYRWKAIGGRLTPHSGDSTINVVWDSVDNKQLIVTRVFTGATPCESAPLVIGVATDRVLPNITGDTAVCANGYFEYDSHYTTGDIYDWKILPGTAGSITDGAHGSAITVLWNDVTALTTATIVVHANKCDSSGADTFSVTIRPGIPASLTPFTSPSCYNTPISVYANAGDSLYLWSFGDGATATTTINAAVHYYPNPMVPGGGYNTKVTVIPHKRGGCEPFGSSSVTVPVLPGPIAYASFADLFCNGIGTFLIGNLVNNDGVSIAWYLDSTAIGSGDTLIPPFVGNYHFVATDTNGCITRSNDLYVIADTCHPTKPDTLRCPFPNPNVGTSANCNVITLSGDLNLSISTHQWYPYLTPTTATSLFTRLAFVTYDLPGIYQFGYMADFECDTIPVLRDTIGIIPDFTWTLKCGTGGYDTIFLHDRSLYLSFYSITSIDWYDQSSGSPVLIGTGANIYYVVPASGTYNILATVGGTRPGTPGTFSCDATHNIAVPSYGVTPSFTTSYSSICTGEPVSFTPTITSSVTNFNWDFGDGSTSRLDEPKRAFDYSGIGTFTTYTVTLTVTDSIGCVGSITQTLDVYPNLLNGTMDTGGAICLASVPYSLGYNSIAGTPASYIWSTGATSVVPNLNVSKTGSYFAIAVDAYQCYQKATNYELVNVIQTPKPKIGGKRDYCYGDNVTLYTNAGDEVHYQWFRNDTLIDSTVILVDGGRPAGDYQYQLVLRVYDSLSGVSCYDTSAKDTIRVHALPPKPAIAPPVMIHVPSYHVLLTASEPVPGIFNWSNGVFGPSNDIYSGGDYKVWFTDVYNCTSDSDTYVPMSPETYFPYFPEGCYTLCNQQLPLLLYGVPDVRFAYYAWLKDGGVAKSGVDTVMSPYNVDTSGDYQWVLGNGLCTDTSADMFVSLVDCDCHSLLSVMGTIMTASVTCNPSTPYSFDISVQIASPGAGTTYSLATDRGPIAPFSGVFSSGGWQPPMTLSYTYVGYGGAIPDSVTIELAMTAPGGGRCFNKLKVKLPKCTWTPAYRPAPPVDSVKTTEVHDAMTIGTAMLVFPNPSSGSITVSYDYGTDAYKTKALVIYDELGRKMQETTVQQLHGSWSLDASGWSSGMYIVRMEGDGKPLQTGKIMITH